MANNTMRKINAVVRKELYTAEVLEQFNEKYNMLPVNTIAEWNKLGFSINKGEKVSAWAKYWVKYDKLNDEEKAKVKKTFDTEDGTKLAQVFAGIFTLNQVHPTYADYSTRQSEMLDFLVPKKKRAKRVKEGQK